jgi:hypothetical protein
MGQLTRVLIGDTSESGDVIGIAEGRRGVGSMYRRLNGRLLQDSVRRVDACVSALYIIYILYFEQDRFALSRLRTGAR